MIRLICAVVLLGFYCISCSSTKDTTQPDSEPVRTNLDVPIISYDIDTIHIGRLVEGEKRQLLYTFKNTGTDTLFIDLATACRCTDLKWPENPIPPGERGEILVEFDSTGFSGEVTKTIDVIANTEPIVKLAWFTANVVKE